MKKYFAGLFAVVLAVGFSAFTSSTIDDEYVFIYTGSTFGHEDVANRANWELISLSTCATSAPQEVPCSFALPKNEDYLEVLSGRTIPSSAIQIIPEETLDNQTFKVDEVKDVTINLLVGQDIRNVMKP
jgi:hypothetical protein